MPSILASHRTTTPSLFSVTTFSPSLLSVLLLRRLSILSANTLDILFFRAARYSFRHVTTTLALLIDARKHDRHTLFDPLYLRGPCGCRSGASSDSNVAEPGCKSSSAVPCRDQSRLNPGSRPLRKPNNVITRPSAPFPMSKSRYCCSVAGLRSCANATIRHRTADVSSSTSFPATSGRTSHLSRSLSVARPTARAGMSSRLGSTTTWLTRCSS